MGYHRNFGCNTGCCDDKEALASVTRTGTVLNFADTSGKQTTIDLSEILPDPNRLVSAERSGTKLNFTDNKGNITTLDLADLIPSFDGVTDVAATTLGIRVTMSNGKTKDIDLSKLYTAPVALNGVSRSGTTLTFTDTNGGQHTVELEAAPEVPVAYKDARLAGSILTFTDTAGNTHDVDLSNLVPAGKADRFLSNVQYDPAAKKLTFTTSATGEADSTFEVNIADLLPVTVGDGLTGNGTASSPVKVNAEALKGSGIKVVDNKFTVDYDTTTMEMTEDGKLRAKQQPAQAGGLDCAAIAALPKAAWKPETSILVNQDGECKRLVPVQNLFQEVGVSMAANKLSGVVGDAYDVVVTVTNSAEAVNDLTDLVITKPQLGNYTLKDFNSFASAGAEIEKVSDLVYKIKKLKSGGTARVTFKVVANATGALQFGASVNPNTSLDLQDNNNQASLTLSSTLPVTADDPTYKPSVDCPLVRVTEVGSNKVLFTGLPSTVSSGGAFVDRFNISHRPLTNLQLKLENVDDVKLLTTYEVFSPSMLTTSLNMALMHNYKWDVGLTSAMRTTDALEKANVLDGRNGNTSFTFDKATQLFTYTGKSKALCVLMRPAGASCRWQVCVILQVSPHTEVPETECSLSVAESDGVKVTSRTKTVKVKYTSDGRPYKDVDTYEVKTNATNYSSLVGGNIVEIGTGANGKIEFYQNAVATSSRFTTEGYKTDIATTPVNANLVEKVEITAGAKRTFTVTSCTDAVEKQDGKISYVKIGTRPFVVTVSADATPSNSFTIDGVPFNIV
jgi:hypothetical protein